MADGDVLTLNSALPGGSGSIDGEDKFEWVAPPTPPTVPQQPGIPGYGMFLSGAWYSPGPPYASSGGQLVYGTPTSGILWAIPTLFAKAGTLTDLATYSAGNGGSSTKVYVAVYRSNAAGTAPGARIFSGEATVPNFTHTKTEFNGLGIAVAANEVLWFATVTNGPQCLGVTPASMFPCLGTNFDGTGGSSPVRALVVGYRLAFAYAQPPDPWVGTTPLLATQDTGAGAAAPLFKFTPT